MISLALIGKNISHSLSPQIYKELLNQEIDYQLYDCANERDIPALQDIFKKHQGLSITSPYKKFFLDKVLVMAGFELLNAVNAIRKNGDIFEAINTDYLAIDKILEEFKGFKIIVLGGGVMSKITEKILEKKGLEYKVFSREKNGAIEEINLTKVFRSENENILIINSCSRDFIFNGTLPKNSIFWDYNYDFKPHQDLIPTKNVRYIDGINLLKLQAKFALEFFRF